MKEESTQPKRTVLIGKMKRVIVRKNDFTTTQMIAYGFLVTILIGTILLSLPISSASGEFTNIIDSLFTATTSLCVTGLTTVYTYSHWSFFGKLVILFLIQFGGLGVVTFTTTILLALRKRITLKERLLIQDAYNLDTLKGLVRLTIRIIKGTLIIEGVGAILYAIKYIPEFGFVDGCIKAIFNSVSAFCNAGMDIIGETSLAPYKFSPLINFTTMFLIIVGGIGFPVWWDIIKILKNRMRGKLTFGTIWRKMELHTKLALSMTAVLIVVGAISTLLLEYNNPNTLGGMSFGNKVMSATFQSVTTRTAGFQTIAQENFTNASNVLFLILMFIGGSPSGTAGGIKTVTVSVLILAVLSCVKGKQDVEVFKRNIPDYFVKKSIAVFGISFAVLLVSTFALSITENGNFIDIIYETTSAIATVGLSRGFTMGLSVAGKIIIIITMYLGRIGPITLALALNTHKKEKTNARKFPTDKILVG